MDSILLNKNKDSLDVTATNKFVFPVVTIDVEVPFDNILIPFEVVPYMSKFLGDTAEMSINETTVRLKSADKEIYFNTLSRAFFNYKKLFKLPAPTSILNIGEVDILSVIKRVGILFDGDRIGIEMVIADGGITFSSKGEGGEIKETLDVNYNADPISLYINSMYLTSAIEAAGENAIFKFYGVKKPILITNTDETYKCLVMPINRRGTEHGS
jgi:DNA polymerase III sliding clamp (beta) subunit (PCNA family)